MSRSFTSQFFSKSGQGSGEKEQRQRRERALDTARRGGLPGLVDKFDPFRKDAWGVERQRKQKVVRDQYFRDKQRTHVQERRAEEQLRRRMDRRKQEIDDYYRIGELGKTDPRIETASQKAQRKYGRYEKKVQRKHHRQWLHTFRKMRVQRDKQYRRITKMMKKEARRRRGLPDEGQAPWNI